ncbi:hypothetical protein WJX84_000845 [Apatococcus fuscideae]|uniref:Chorein N-terminal domain-containing protein n=1 Tax=Apatococcus fuscideae TaxID=2026836 RepID=A0AAW1SLF3_9CHLO
MFEGWLADLLAGYLGHFVNIKREQLRFSFWQAWSTGVVLENLDVIPEAFDYLQLPFQIVKGSVGRLEAQLPWSPLRSRCLTDGGQEMAPSGLGAGVSGGLQLLVPFKM